MGSTISESATNGGIKFTPKVKYLLKGKRRWWWWWRQPKQSLSTFQCPANEKENERKKEKWEKQLNSLSPKVNQPTNVWQCWAINIQISLTLNVTTHWLWEPAATQLVYLQYRQTSNGSLDQPVTDLNGFTANKRTYWEWMDGKIN